MAQRWTLRAGIFLLPLLYSPFTYDSYVLPKLIFARLVVVVLFLLFLARIAITRTVVLKRTPLDVPLVLFLGSAVLSSVFAENRNVAWLGTYTRYDGLLTLFTYAALYWLSVQSLVDAAEARGLMRALLASGYAVGVVAIMQSLHDSIQQSSVAPAYGSLGNANVLGAFLALVITLAVGELVVAKSAAAQILLANVLVVSSVALGLSLSRSGWLGALVGAVVVLAFKPGLSALRFAVPAVAVVAAVLAVAYAASAPGQLERSLVDRALSIADPRAIAHARLGIWGDSLRLIASRPITGYGPDNVGLVFPRFQSGDWGFTYNYVLGNVRLPIDKTHAELLQVAATQGLIGLAAYVLLQLAFLRALWRARRADQAVIAGAGWIAYHLVVQLSFTALAAAMPFWMFAAAAIVSCNGVRVHTLAAGFRRSSLVLVPGVVLAAAAMWWGAAVTYAADASLRKAVDADYSGRPADAERLAAEARQLAPWESVYAVEVANVAFEQQQWKAARESYRAAAELGTFNALVYRNLALADRNLGLRREGRIAAAKAVELDPFDPANQALLAEFGTARRNLTASRTI